MNAIERQGLGRAISRVIDMRLEPMREVLRLALARIEKLEAANATNHRPHASKSSARAVSRTVAAHKYNRKRKENHHARRLR